MAKVHTFLVKSRGEAVPAFKQIIRGTRRQVMMRRRPHLRCVAGHRIWSYPCPHCRARRDGLVRKYFRRLSDRLLREAA